MKGFLFDENLPVRLAFTPSLPVEHIGGVHLRGLSDASLWQQARQRELVIVTKDTDFAARVMVEGPPPWVVHLRFGNLRLRQFHTYLSSVWPRIETLLPVHKLINVHLDRIEALR